MELLLCILIFLLIFIFASILVTQKDYKYYKKGYKALKKATLVEKGTYPYYQTTFYDSESNTKLIYWIKDKDFKIGNSINYLHNQFYTYLSPYSLYWYIKYRKLIKTKI